MCAALRTVAEFKTCVLCRALVIVEVDRREAELEAEVNTEAALITCVRAVVAEAVKGVVHHAVVRADGEDRDVGVGFDEASDPSSRAIWHADVVLAAERDWAQSATEVQTVQINAGLWAAENVARLEGVVNAARESWDQRSRTTDALVVTEVAVQTTLRTVNNRQPEVEGQQASTV